MKRPFKIFVYSVSLVVGLLAILAVRKTNIRDNAVAPRSLAIHRSLDADRYPAHTSLTVSPQSPQKNVPAKKESSAEKRSLSTSPAPTNSAQEILRDTLLSLSEESKSEKGGAFTNPLGSWHQHFVDDSLDSSWSPMAQAQAESYLTGIVGSDIEIVAIKCAATVCEIQAASTTAQNSEGAANNWQASMSAMSKESWWKTYGFAPPNSAIWSATDGRALMVSYLPRLK